MPPHQPRTPSIRTSSSSGSTPASTRKTWLFSGFTASTAAFYLPHATDTISFVVEAPSGYYISTITYTQRGTGAVARSGKATGSSQWVVDNQPEDLGVFGTNPTLTGRADFTGLNRAQVPVSITTSLFVFAPPLVGSATITLTSAEVLVELEEAPVAEAEPPAAVDPG